MLARGPLVFVSTIAVLIHLAALFTAAQWGLRASLNFIPPAAGSLLAVWLVHKHQKD